MVLLSAVITAAPSTDYWTSPHTAAAAAFKDFHARDLNAYASFDVSGDVPAVMDDALTAIDDAEFDI